MKKKSLLFSLALLLCSAAQAQVTLHAESFETDGEGPRYTSNTYSFCPTDPDYFLRTNTNPVLPTGGCAVGFGSTLTNLQGSFFWAGEDIMSNQQPFPGNHSPGQITTQNINIAGYSSLTVSLYLATASNNGARWETADSINIHAKIDGGSFFTVGRFMGSAPTGGRLRLDGNLDGAITGADPLTNCDTIAFTKYTFNIPGGGTTLNVRIDFDQYGGTEESAIDLIEVQGTLSPCIAPTITCPVAQTLGLGANCQANLPDYTALGIVTGTCSPVTTQAPLPVFLQMGPGTLNLTLTVTNTAAQSSTCAFTVTVVDSIAPVAVCQNISAYLDANGLQAVAPGDIDNGSTDNCALNNLSLDFFNFDCNDLGIQNVVLTLTDDAGNSSTCTATILVVDSIAPVAICQPTSLYLDAQGNCSLSAGDIDGGSTDNCGIASLSASPSTFTAANIGSNAVVLTVTDAGGNTATCTTTVTVLDTLVAVDDPMLGQILFAVLPNPAHDRMQVQVECKICSSDDELALQLWSMNGQLLRTLPVTADRRLQHLHLDLSGLAAGNYMLSLRHNGRVLTRRVIRL